MKYSLLAVGFVLTALTISMCTSVQATPTPIAQAPLPTVQPRPTNTLALANMESVATVQATPTLKAGGGQPLAQISPPITSTAFIPARPTIPPVPTLGLFEDAATGPPARPLNQLLFQIAGQRLVPSADTKSYSYFYADYEPLDPTAASKTVGSQVSLDVGTSNETAARSVREGRDNGYPRNPATLNINGVTVYEGWTTDGTSHYLAWAEGITEASLDTATRTQASVDSAALKRQGMAVAAALCGHLRN